MAKRKLRSTFLFRLVVTLGLIGWFISVVLFCDFWGWGIVAGVYFCVFCILFCAVAIGLDVLPSLIARITHNNGENADAPLTGWKRWCFEDVSAEKRRKYDKFVNDTSDNPTIR